MCSDRQTDFVGYIGVRTDRQTFGRTLWPKQKKSLHTKNFFICCSIFTKRVLKHPQGYRDSKYMLSFEIE